ncbi:hypothetical protein M885DRAFT_255734 [Pelagophyceae sp. CCMP2097]|nr:hypothetical protein M885DRAFT_255734 [Pelagophyceae sp. CCMP2097]
MPLRRRRPRQRRPRRSAAAPRGGRRGAPCRRRRSAGSVDPAHGRSRGGPRRLRAAAAAVPARPLLGGVRRLRGEVGPPSGRVPSQGRLCPRAAPRGRAGDGPRRRDAVAHRRLLDPRPPECARGQRAGPPYPGPRPRHRRHRRRRPRRRRAHGLGPGLHCRRRPARLDRSPRFGPRRDRIRETRTPTAQPKAEARGRQERDRRRLIAERAPSHAFVVDQGGRARLREPDRGRAAARQRPLRRPAAPRARRRRQRARRAACRRRRTEQTAKRRPCRARAARHRGRPRRRGRPLLRLAPARPNPHPSRAVGARRAPTGRSARIQAPDASKRNGGPINIRL